MALAALVRRRGPEPCQRPKNRGQDDPVALTPAALLPEKPEIQVARSPGVRASDDGRLHGARRIGEVGAERARLVDSARDIDRRAEPHPAPRRRRDGRRGLGRQRRPVLEAEDPVYADVVRIRERPGLLHAALAGVAELLPRPRGERAKSPRAEREEDGPARPWEPFQYLPRRDERVARVVAPAGQDKDAAGRRETAGLLEIQERGGRHRPAGQPHRRPLPALVAPEERRLEGARLAGREDRVAGNGGLGHGGASGYFCGSGAAAGSVCRAASESAFRFSRSTSPSHSWRWRAVSVNWRGDSSTTPWVRTGRLSLEIERK